MSIMDIFRVNEIKAELARTAKERDSLKIALADTDKMEYYQLKQAIENLGLQKEKANQDLQAAQTEFTKRWQGFDQQLKEMAQQIELQKKEVIVLDDKILLQSFGLYKPHYDLENSEAYRKKLEDIQSQQEVLVKNGKAVTGAVSWTVNNSAKEGQRMIKDYVKLILRSFNNECDASIGDVKFSNVEAIAKRIRKAHESLNKLGERMSIVIMNEYLSLKLQELFIVHEYRVKKQEEKEEQKRAREELREQQKLEQEIRQAREKIAKEKKHFVQAINELESKLKEATSDSDRNLVLEKLEVVKGQYSELEKEEKVIDYREQNAKAGYVYIISNIGSLGENVYKIGMTRRLEPQDRIDELGDASVPFSYDIHALIFSENAPALEAKLHEHFYKSRVNKLNNRKEFFRADIQDIEKVVKDHYDKVVDIIKDAPAEQYRESLLIE